MEPTVESTMELAELDELVASLDTRINEVDVPEDRATLSIICQTYGCGPFTWHC